jgi:hypothetical protein
MRQARLWGRRCSETDSYWGIDNLDVALLDEDLTGFEAETLYVFLRDGFATDKLVDVAKKL